MSVLAVRLQTQRGLVQTRLIMERAKREARLAGAIAKSSDGGLLVHLAIENGSVPEPHRG